jgi:hypothetical protein
MLCGSTLNFGEIRVVVMVGKKSPDSLDMFVLITHYRDEKFTYLFPVCSFHLGCPDEIHEHILLHQLLGCILPPLRKVITSALEIWVLLPNKYFIFWNERSKSSFVCFWEFGGLVAGSIRGTMGHGRLGNGA